MHVLTVRAQLYQKAGFISPFPYGEVGMSLTSQKSDLEVRTNWRQQQVGITL